MIATDINLLPDEVDHECDRCFIAYVFQQGPFSDRQFAWVMELFDRTVQARNLPLTVETGYLIFHNDARSRETAKIQTTIHH